MAYEFDLGDLEGPYTDSEGSQIVEFILGVDPETDTVAVIGPTKKQGTQEKKEAVKRPQSVHARRTAS
jgi:hypothetical protein